MGSNIFCNLFFFPEILTCDDDDDDDVDDDDDDDDVNPTTQSVELLISFRITTDLATPVKLASHRQVWQSPSTLGYPHRKPSDGVFSLIPAEKVVQTPLPKYYERAESETMGK